MLHSAVNVSFNLLIFFPASPVKVIFHDPFSISFPKYVLSLQYNKAKKKKKKKSSYLWNHSQHFIFINYFYTTLYINNDFNGFFWLFLAFESKEGLN